MILALAELFSILIVIGAFLTFLVFRFDLEKLRSSGLLTKIIMWVPLALGFLLILALGEVARLIVGLVILVVAAMEFRTQLGQYRGDRRFVVGYFGFFLVGFVHLGLFRFIIEQPLLIILPVIIATVIADVGGFFLGRSGRHKLPSVINPNKSWEGVAGELMGAFIGVALIDQFIIYQPMLWLALPIGIGAALGDLLNSRAKRLLGVKNWSNAIPGHGGVLDRFCSLAGSSLITFYWILLFSP